MNVHVYICLLLFAGRVLLFFLPVLYFLIKLYMNLLYCEVLQILLMQCVLPLCCDVWDPHFSENTGLRHSFRAEVIKVQSILFPVKAMELQNNFNLIYRISLITSHWPLRLFEIAAFVVSVYIPKSLR